LQRDHERLDSHIGRQKSDGDTNNVAFSEDEPAVMHDLMPGVMQDGL
jgi:hypothetical protein